MHNYLQYRCSAKEAQILSRLALIKGLQKPTGTNTRFKAIIICKKKPNEQIGDFRLSLCLHPPIIDFRKCTILPILRIAGTFSTSPRVRLQVIDILIGSSDSLEEIPGNHCL